MRVAVKKLEGVEQVDVSLNIGLAVITFAPDNRVTVEQVREAIRKNGFTPKEAEVRLAGRVSETGGKLILQVPGWDRPYLLLDHPENAGATSQMRSSALGKDVVIDAVVPEAPKRGAPSDTLRVRSFVIPSSK